MNRYTDVFGDVGHQSADKRLNAKATYQWHVAMRPGKSEQLDKDSNPIHALINKLEKTKASIRIKLEHPLRVIKRQFGFTKVRHRGLEKNTLRINIPLALSNL